ncbi:hypothetical protein A9K55_004939 [Cordyceps militaris]|uniref:Uncharacterized protein n=1 Tax=Cordyceps militaris TaxID=73501 RepID=A0A2H4SLQ3_CORMI|nr:hypothetical protein A9K55_004939 [Cordyceps militaris]
MQTGGQLAVLTQHLVAAVNPARPAGSAPEPRQSQSTASLPPERGLPIGGRSRFCAWRIFVTDVRSAR